MSNKNRQILPHGPIRQIAPSLWCVTGKLPRGNLPRNMMLHRVKDGSLLVHSAIALDEPGMQELETLGNPSLLIVPNKMHRLDAQAYKERYPKIKVICPKAAVEDVNKKVRIEATCEEILPEFGIGCVEPEGVRSGELGYLIDTNDGKALIVTDLLFNLKNMSGLDGFLLKLMGSTGFFGMTAIGKLFMLQNKDLFRAWLLTMSQSNIKFVCMGHGDIITSNASEKLAEAASRL